MNKTVKKIACAALCAVILFCMTVPAFAVTGSNIYSYNDYGIGVHVSCNTILTLRKATAKLQLSFMPNIPHFPETDYVCYAELYLEFLEGGLAFDQDSNTGLFAEAKHDIHSGKTVSTNFFNYYLNDSFCHHDDF